jgi:hypothetical protein
MGASNANPVIKAAVDAWVILPSGLDLGGRKFQGPDLVRKPEILPFLENQLNGGQ